MQKAKDRLRPTLRRCGQSIQQCNYSRLSPRLGKDNTKTSKPTHSLFRSLSTHLNSTSSSRGQTPPLCGELEETNSGHMGPKLHPGVQDIIQYGSLSERNPKICNEQGGGVVYITGDSISPGQRCNNSNFVSPQKFFLHNFHSSQEGWRTPSYNKPERFEQVYSPYPFQDGGYTIPEGYCSSGGLHDQVGSQGCLLFNPYTSFPLEVFDFPVEANVLPVHLSPLWSLQCSQSIYKSNEASYYLPQISGNTDGRLLGRYANSGSYQRGTPQMEVNCSGFIREPRVSHQLRQVRTGTRPESNIPRFSNQHNKNADQTAKRKDQSSSSGGSEAPGGSASVSKTASPPDRSVLRDSSSNPSSSPPLQGSSAFETSSPQERRVRCDSSSFAGSKRRPVMVDPESESCKWSTPSERPAIPPDRDRCISDGLGGSVSGRADRWSLDGRGESTPHKLSGAVGSYICDSSLCQGQTGLGSPCAHGQYHGCSICQSHGRNEVSEALLHDKESLGLVSSATFSPNCIPHPGEAERGSRPTIKVNCGPSRLDAESNDIPSNQFSLESPTGGLVCIQNYQTNSTFFQLETRPTSRSSGCIQADMDGVYGLCEPSMGVNRSLCTIHPSAGCNDSANHPTMARSAVVPNSVSSLTGQSEATSSVPRPSNESSGSQVSISKRSQSVGRMVHLRQSYQGAGISDKATALLLASWRSSTTKNYNSSWRVWEQWCVQSSTNPISPSLSDILNFIAYQFHQGKQYRSLNCYRSALSSVLAPIEGFDIGRHPLVCRILKGAFQLRPPKAKYTTFWSVEQVLSHLASWGDNQSLPLQKLTLKLAMLLALCSASRTSDLTKLSIGHRFFCNGKVIFYPTGLAKQSSPDNLPTPIEFRAFPDNLLCPVQCLQRYEAITTSFRVKSEQQQLFLSLKKPHSPVVSSSIARWLKSVLTSSGVDTSIFSAHSTRGASTSAASLAGVTTQQILSTADWSIAKVFKKFYFRDGQVQSPRQGFDLSVLTASKSRCDTEPEPSDMQL